MLELAVHWVGAVGINPHLQGTRHQRTDWFNIIPCEQVNSHGRSGDMFGDAKLAVGVISRRA